MKTRQEELAEARARCPALYESLVAALAAQGVTATVAVSQTSFTGSMLVTGKYQLGTFEPRYVGDPRASFPRGVQWTTGPSLRGFAFPSRKEPAGGFDMVALAQKIKEQLAFRVAADAAAAKSSQAAQVAQQQANEINQRLTEAFPISAKFAQVRAYGSRLALDITVPDNMREPDQLQELAKAWILALHAVRPKDPAP